MLRRLSDFWWWVWRVRESEGAWGLSKTRPTTQGPTADAEALCVLMCARCVAKEVEMRKWECGGRKKRGCGGTAVVVAASERERGARLEIGRAQKRCKR